MKKIKVLKKIEMLNITKPLITLAITALLSSATYASSATDPQTISFAENQQITLQLSNTDPNRLVVANDSINHITCPGYACDVKNNADDASGSIYLSVRGTNPYTAFICKSIYYIPYHIYEYLIMAVLDSYPMVITLPI